MKREEIKRPILWMTSAKNLIKNYIKHEEWQLSFRYFSVILRDCDPRGCGHDRDHVNDHVNDRAYGHGHAYARAYDHTCHHVYDFFIYGHDRACSFPHVHENETVASISWYFLAQLKDFKLLSFSAFCFHHDCVMNSTYGYDFAHGHVRDCGRDCVNDRVNVRASCLIHVHGHAYILMNMCCFSSHFVSSSLNYSQFPHLYGPHYRLKVFFLDHECGLPDFPFDSLDDNVRNLSVSDNPHHRKEAHCKRMLYSWMGLDHYHELHDDGRKSLPLNHENDFLNGVRST